MYTIIKLHMTQFSVFYYVPMSLDRDCCSTVITSNYPSEHWMALLLFKTPAISQQRFISLHLELDRRCFRSTFKCIGI